MSQFKVIESGAFADYEFEARAKTIEELFEICAIAAFEAMTDTSGVDQSDLIEFKLNGENFEELLFAFLAELIYLKDVNLVLFSKFDISIDNDFGLSAKCWGEIINPGKHELKTDVKAVTYHRLSIAKTSDGYKAHVILDL